MTGQRRGYTGAVLKVAVPVPLPGVFDYLPPTGEPAPGRGQRVRVRFGRRQLVALVTGRADGSTFPEAKLQPVLEVLDPPEERIPESLLALLEWCARYYKHALGEVVFGALPPDFRKPGSNWPPPPMSMALTAAGQGRLSEPPGRAKAQHRLLSALADGPMVASELLTAGEASRPSLDALLEAGWVEARPTRTTHRSPGDAPTLTGEQDQVLKAIRAEPPGFCCHLLDGITGSGKTEVYLRLIHDVLDAGRQVLVLVPEIGLTPQLLRRLGDRLGVTPMAFHSGLAAGERMGTWAAAARGDAPLLVGTRSALFLPLATPGLIVMDEAHDPSFKQQDGFRYAARDVAVKRALDLGIPIVLGTATPSLETLHNALHGRYRHHHLRERATGAKPPSIRVVDLRARQADAGLCAEALTAIGDTLERGEQALVFLNRRGYAPVLLCHECGWHASCRNCDANMTWHRSARILVCHHCEARARPPVTCPDCRADALQGAGEGTEQLEQVLARRFPDTPVHRVDRDAVRRKGELEALINKVRGGEPCLLVGTQMLAKGHHFPKVTLVVVVNLDQALYSADFRALERMGQVLVQVAGRAGRAAAPGTVILQTHHPDHLALRCLVEQGYAAFARAQLDERRLAMLPPFSHQAVLRADAVDRESLRAFLEQARNAWTGLGMVVHGPFPAMMEKRAGRVRWYLLAQADARGALQASLDQWLEAVRRLPAARKVRWAIDVDPQEF